MTRPSMRKIVDSLRTWAASANGVNRILITGSRAKETLSDDPIRPGDIDVVVYLSNGGTVEDVLRDLSEIGLKWQALVHPLILEEQDLALKESIPEYQNMLRSGVEIFSAAKH
jgi:hypothetical protein